MRFLALLFLVFATSCSHAGPEQNEMLRSILIKAMTNQSRILQLLIKCEASPELIQKMSDLTMASMSTYRKTDPQGSTSFDAAFKEGKVRADYVYQQLGKEANLSPVCQQAAQIARDGLDS